MATTASKAATSGSVSPPRVRIPGWLGASGPLDRLPLAAAIALVTLLGIVPVLLAALVFDQPTFAFWAVLVTNLVLLFVLAVLTLGRPVVFIGTLVIWYSVQRFVVAVVAPEVEPDTVRLLITYKEGFYLILVAAAAVWLTAAYARGERTLTPIFACDALAVLMLAGLALAFLISDSDTSDRLTYARRLAAPLILYLGGRMLITEFGQLRDGLRVVVTVGLAVAGFGIIERFILPHTFWSDTVNALGFYGEVAESGLLPAEWIRPQNGLPEGIYSAFPLDIPVRRLVSTFMEPTTLASFLAFVLLLVLFVPELLLGRFNRWSPALASVLALALAGTVGRGGMQTTLIAGGAFLAAAWFGLKWRPSRRILAGAAITFVILAPALMVASLSFSQLPNRREQLQDVLSESYVSGFPDYEPPPIDPNAPIDPGVQAHVNGLTSGLEAMLDDPLGRGLGAAGNWSVAPEVGGESAIGTIAAQLGVFGLAVWLGFHAALIVALAVGAYVLRDDEQRSRLLLILAAALLGLQFTALFSESASGLLGNALYYLFAGWALAAAFKVRGFRASWAPDTNT